MIESGSIASATITLAVAAVGAGVLAFPLAFADAGIVLSAVILFIVAFFTVISIYYISLSIEHLALCSYEEQTRELLGPRYETAIRYMLIGFNFGVAVGYVVVIAEMLVPVHPVAVAYILTHFAADSVFGQLAMHICASPTHMLVAVWAVTMFPLSLIRSVSMMRHSSLLAIAASSYIVCVIVYRYFFPLVLTGPSMEADTVKLLHTRHGSEVTSGHLKHLSHVLATAVHGDTTHRATTTASDPYGEEHVSFANFHFMMFLALPIMMYSLDCQVFVFQLYVDLQARYRNAAGMARIAAGSMCIAFCLYFAVGTFGYLSFGDRTKGNILQNYHPTKDPLMAIGYTVYAVPVIMAYTLTMFPCRDAVFNLRYGVSAADQSSIPAPTYLGWSAAISAITLTIGILTPGIVVVIGLLGALCSSTLCFTYPALYRLALHRRDIVPFGGGIASDVLEYCFPAKKTATDAKLTATSPAVAGEKQPLTQKQTDNKTATAYGTAVSPSTAAATGEQAEGADAPVAVHVFTEPEKQELQAAHPSAASVERILCYSMLVLGLIGGTLGTVVAVIKVAAGEAP